MEAILADLNIEDKSRVLVLNKADKMPRQEAASLAARFGGVAVSALASDTFAPMLDAIEEGIWHESELKA